MAFTTSAVANKGTTLDVAITNDNLTNVAVVELEVFSVTTSTTQVAKTPLVHQLFSVPPLVAIIKTIDITGVPNYEAQFNVTGAVPGDVKVSDFVSDVNGNVIAAERILQSEQTIIMTITPEP